jgi:hypothetical protein
MSATDDPSELEALATQSERTANDQNNAVSVGTAIPSGQNHPRRHDRRGRPSHVRAKAQQEDGHSNAANSSHRLNYPGMAGSTDDPHAALTRAAVGAAVATARVRVRAPTAEKSMRI